MDASSYRRLTEAEEGGLTEAERALQPVLTALRTRLTETAAARPAGTGVAVSLTVGTGEAAERWVVDLRPGIPLERAIVRSTGSAQAAAVEVAVRVRVPDPSDLLALVERRLPPFRALAQRRLILDGDLSQLRSLSWLMSGAEADASGGAVRVHVLRADAASGHGEYVLRVDEGAAAWVASRRWSELKALHAELVGLYGRGGGNSLELSLPSVPSSYRSSTAAAVLAKRSKQMEAYLASVLRYGCACACVCMYVCMYVCMHAYMYEDGGKWRPVSRPFSGAMITMHIHLHAHTHMRTCTTHLYPQAAAVLASGGVCMHLMCIRIYAHARIHSYPQAAAVLASGGVGATGAARVSAARPRRGPKPSPPLLTRLLLHAVPCTRRSPRGRAALRGYRAQGTGCRRLRRSARAQGTGCRRLLRAVHVG